MKKTAAWVGLVMLAASVVMGDTWLSNSPATPDLPPGASVYASLLGQFRYVVANALWIKADMYHHEFIRHDPHWTQETDIMPLIRMITWLDPHFTQAYASGAWMLGLYQHRPAQAKAFLQEGLRNNPKCWQLYETRAILKWRCDNNLRAALQDLKRAEAVANEDFYKRSLARSVADVERQLNNPGKDKQYPEKPDAPVSPPGG